MYDSVSIEVFQKLDFADPPTSKWVDISDHIPLDTEISFSRGIMGNNVKDRTARIGMLTFYVEDDTGEIANPFYTVSDPILNIGNYVRVVAEKDGVSRCLWYGLVTVIQPPRDELFETLAFVTCKDILTKFNEPLLTPSILTNKTVTDVVDEVVDDLDITLTTAQKNYGTMTRTFSTVFDTTRSKQNGWGEISKAVLSEFGYIFPSGSRDIQPLETNYSTYIPTDGQWKLTIQGRGDRATASYPTIPVSNDNAGFLLQEDGDYLLQETGDYIVLDETETFETFEGVSINKKYSVGELIVNECCVTVYPRDIDSSTQVLFTLENTPKIDAGETLEFTTSYKDPNQLAQSVTAFETQTPVAYTDYEAYENNDETGADLTANLSVTAEYTAAEIKYTLENTGGTDLYVTKLQARGKGIYLYQSTKAEAISDLSKKYFGTHILTLNLKYLSDIEDGQEIADTIVTDLDNRFPSMDSITIPVNTNSQTEMACLFLDIGDPIKIDYLQSDNTSWPLKYYINGITWRGNKGRWFVDYKPCYEPISEL